MPKTLCNYIYNHLAVASGPNDKQQWIVLRLTAVDNVIIGVLW